MDQIAPGAPGDPDDLARVEIGSHAFTLEQVGLVGEPHMGRGAVVRGVHGHGPQAERRRRAVDPDRDLAPVGDQHTCHRTSPPRARDAGLLYVTASGCS